MSFSSLSEECAGFEHFLLGTIAPDHTACRVSLHVNGVIGGWNCSCECHLTAPDDNGVAVGA